jgi:TRAP transporter TAXI family solute receptor
MGVVYLAHQVNLDRRVAIKMIRSGCLAGENEIHRFYAEARSAARLDHSNIVTVHQCGEIDGHHYFSMDYIPGTDLARRIKEGPMSAMAAARYVRDIALAIAYAHSQGIVHRDLKPANVLINEKDEVVITDFGLAKIIDSDGGLTQSGTALGTPSYMSPEQADGDTAAQGQTTDVYSIGAILFALLTGKPPFQGATAVQTIMDVIHKPAPDTVLLRPDVPLDLDTIVAKCLDKKPTNRYPTAVALAEELDRFLRGEPIHSRPISFVYRSIRWLANVPLIAALIGQRNIEATVAHRRVQYAMITMFFLFPILLFGSYSLQQRWIDRHLPSKMRIASGVPEGVYHRVARVLADRLYKSLGVTVTIEDTAGSNDNLARLLSKQADLAMLQATSVRSDKVAVVAPLYYEAVHVVARTNRGINDIRDFAGHRVAVGPKDSGTHSAASFVLDAYGIQTSTFESVMVDWTKLDEDPTIDAAFLVMKSGHPQIKALLESNEFQLLPIADAQGLSLTEPTYKSLELSSKDYEILGEKKIETLATTAFLATSVNAPSRLVTECLKALYSAESDFEGLIPPKRAANWVGLPFHPAARAYYRTILDQ